MADIARNVELRPLVRESFQSALEEIRLADEVGDELVDGVVIDLLRGADLFHNAGAHDDDAVGRAP